MGVIMSISGIICKMLFNLIIEERFHVFFRFDLQKVILGTISNREVNFRIQAQSLEVLLGGGNKCTGRPISAINQPQSRGRYPQYF